MLVIANLLILIAIFAVSMDFHNIYDFVFLFLHSDANHLLDGVELLC